MMTLKQLVAGIPDCLIKGDGNLVIESVTSNSKFAKPGSLFIVKKGRAYDGGKFIEEAILGGACAIISDNYDPSLSAIAQVIHPHVALIEGCLAASFYRFPSRELFMAGVTGTNGKTTTSFIVKNLLDRLKGLCGVIGTIEYILGKETYPATLTTPDVLSNQRMLREMVEQGCESAVMEVSSHALDQGRVDHIEFDVAIFTNLTLEHLDYHGSMEDYGDAKRKLFRTLGENKVKKTPSWAIVNQDSPWTPRMLQGCSSSILSYGIDAPADLQATHILFEGERTSAQVSFKGERVNCTWPFVGRFNVYNSLAAMAVPLCQGIPLGAVSQWMAEMPCARGRLQLVPNKLGVKIFVDFAHSDDALLNVLTTLKEMQGSSGRLVVVFGCGGDRDCSKRPKMGAVCSCLADYTFITSDNPRSEDPAKIAEEIAVGFSAKEQYEVEVDRRVAIEKAIRGSRLDDIVLIAGRGHEPYQSFADQKIEFDDYQVASEICCCIIQTEYT